MKLAQAALYFDRDTVYDAYTGLKLWKAQFSSYDAAKPDGSFERRRTVSMAPGQTPPPRGVVKVQKDKWVLGSFVEDTFYDGPIRLTACAKLVTDTYEILTPGQAALQAYSTPSTYAQTRYLKSTVNTLTTSAYTAFYEVFFGAFEQIKKGYFLKSDKRLLRVRDVNLDIEGHLMVQADEVNTSLGSYDLAGFVTVGVSTGFDPITETYGPATTHTGILVPLYMIYDYRTEADDWSKAGDKAVVLSNIVPVSAGDIITINGENWQVKTKVEYYDAWNLHVRRA